MRLEVSDMFNAAGGVFLFVGGALKLRKDGLVGMALMLVAIANVLFIYAAWRRNA